MSETKVDEINKKIKKIETIGTPVSKSKPAPTNAPKTKEYGSYQKFQKECMQKVEPSKKGSPSRIEVITGQEGVHSTERLAQCSVLWGKYRDTANPIDGLMNELDVAQKVERGEEP